MDLVHVVICMMHAIVSFSCAKGARLQQLQNNSFSILHASVLQDLQLSLPACLDHMRCRSSV